MVDDSKNRDNSSSSKKNIFEKQNHIPMGQYVPVHRVADKLTKEELSKIDAKEFLRKIPQSNPFEKKIETEHKLCFYDGDYLKNQTHESLYSFSGNMFVRFFKIIFFNLPIINFLYLKFKESKIKDSISTLNSLNCNVNEYAKHFEGRSIINEQKYQQICTELIRTNNLQTKNKSKI